MRWHKENETIKNIIEYEQKQITSFAEHGGGNTALRGLCLLLAGRAGRNARRAASAGQIYPLELTAGGLQALSAPASAPSARGTADDDWGYVSDVAVQVGDEVKKYRVASVDGSIAWMTSDAPFYWQTSEQVMDITAWYPYSDASPAMWTVKADQSDAADYRASNFIKGSLTLKFTERDTDKNRITFYHQTAKICVTLNSEGVTLDNNTSVKLRNVSGVEGGGSDIT